ncbi:MAG: hypothetical protein ACOC80_11360, partial [Petrotogales bacterium]
MLFPNAPERHDQENRDILSRMEKFYSDSLTINQAFWAEAETDTRFEAGDQTLWNELYSNLPEYKRKNFNFNRIKRLNNMVSGHQRNNRKSTIVIPVENGDQKTADQFTKIIMWINQQENVLNTISDAFQGALTTGMNLLHVWIDYRNDPVSGNVKIDNCPYNSFLIDPYFKKPDLSDCNGLWKRAYITKDEALSLLPDKADEIENINPLETNRDGKFQYLPENYNLSSGKLLTYDEFYYRDYREQEILIDSETGEALEWKHNDEEALKYFLSVYPQIKRDKQKIPTVKLAIVVNGHVMYDGQNPLGIDVYPFVPVFTYFNPQMSSYEWRIQGLVRGLRDAQYLYNRRKIIELDIFESQVNSGWVYKPTSLINPKDVYLSGQGRGIGLKRSAQMTDVQRIEPSQVPASMVEVSKSLGEEINQISGVSDELLGMSVNDKSGILTMLKQSAGVTTLQPIFDNLDQSQKILGKILISIIQNNFTPGKIKRIIEDEPTQEFYDKKFGLYDAAIEEGVNTTTQRQVNFVQLLHLKEAGIPIPDEEIIKASTLQNKNDLIESIQRANQQREQEQQATKNIELQELKSRANLADARAAADRGLAIERTSRVDENESLAVERQAEAVKDRMAGVFDLVKALKEIESIDINQLKTLVALSKMLKSEESGAKLEPEQQ